MKEPHLWNWENHS